MNKLQACKRLISLLLCAVLVIGMVPVSARAVTMTGGEVLYLTPNGNWKADGARFAIYVYGTGNAWASMTDGDGDGVYEATVPEGSWTNVIFCRMNGSTTENNWDNKWNQSGDLEYDGTNNHCTIDEGQWDCDTNVTWSVYTPSSDEPEVTTDLVVTTEVTEGYTYTDGVLTFTQGGDYTVSMNTDITATDDIIVVDAENVNLTLDNVTINAPDGGYEEAGKTALTLNQAASLILVGTNALTGGNGGNSTTHSAGHGGHGISGTVTLSGATLTVTGGNGGNGETLDGESGNGGSGISGAVTVSGGTLTANGGNGGSGYYGGNGGSGISGAVTVSGGTLTANGGNGGSGDSEGTDGKAFGSTLTVGTGLNLVIKAGANADSAAEVESYSGEKYAQVTEPSEPEEPVDTMTVYFQNNWVWSDVRVYYWYEDDSFDYAWPGMPMTFVENDGAYDIYSAEIPVNAAGINFNGIKDDGSDSRDKSPNIEGDAILGDTACYYMTWDNGNSYGTFDYTPTVTTDLVVTTEVADGYTYTDGVLTFTQGGDYTVSMNTDITATDDIIVVDAEGVNLTLDNVTINAPAGEKGLYIDGTSGTEGKTALTLNQPANLTLVGTNALTGGEGGYADLSEGTMTTYTGGSGIRGDVTVSGIGSLTATGGTGASDLYGGKVGGSGISGAVTLTGGTLTANGGNGDDADYGTGGNGGTGISGAVTVSGGTLTANGGNGGSGNYEGDDGKAFGSTLTAGPGYALVVKAGADADSAAEVETYNNEKYAQVTVEEGYTVSFAANGGSGTMASFGVKKDSAYTLPACGFTAPTGNVFRAWQVGDTEYAPGDPITVTGDITVTALWMTARIVTLKLTDSFGDSWNGNAITVKTGDTVVGTYAAEHHGGGNTASTDTVTLELDPTKDYTFTWTSGSYPEEASFVIEADGEEKYACPDGSSLTPGEVFYTLEAICPHNFEGSTTCTLCDKTCGVDFDHEIGADGSCGLCGTALYTVTFAANGGTGEMAAVGVEKDSTYTLPACGFTAPTGNAFRAWQVGDTEYAPGDPITVTGDTTVTALWKTARIVTLKLTDTYGDGWNYASITVKTGDVEVGTYTINSGSTATHTLELDPTKDYTFTWTSGSYNGECSFVIEADGEEKYACSNGSSLTHGEVFYTLEAICDHNFEGSTTCTLCGKTCGVDFAHDLDTDGKCTLCGTVFTLRTVTVGETANGTVTPSPEAAYASQTVTLTITPATGYVPDTIAVTDGSGSEIPLGEDNTFTMPDSNVTVTVTFRKDAGDFVITGDESGWNFVDGVLTFTQGGDYTVALQSGISSTDDIIVVDAENVNLTLSNVTIKAPAGENGFYIDGTRGTEGKTALTLNHPASLILVGTNALTGGRGGAYSSAASCTGLDGGSGIRGDVTISGAGSLNAAGGSGDNGYSASGGKGGSGISGTVTLSGGILTVTGGSGGNGYNIGEAGDGGSGITGAVTLTGGTLTATGGKGGEGEESNGGSGGIGISGTVTLSGGTLTVTGGNGGYGDEINGTDGKALDGTVTAAEGKTLILITGAEADSAANAASYTGEKYLRATISGGTAYSVTVSDAITGGTVTADLSEALAGQLVTLTLTPDEGLALLSLTVTDGDGNAVEVSSNRFYMLASDVTVTAQFGGEYGDFVVSGAAEGITYTEGVLTFTQGGDYTVALKSGISSTDDIIVVDAENVNLTLSNVTINAPDGGTSESGKTALTLNQPASLTLVGTNALRGGKGGTGVDAGYGGAGISGQVTISGGTLTATGGDGGGGMCAGRGGAGISGTVILTGGTLTATGGNGGSGEGGGRGGEGISGTVTLTGGTLTATGGNGGSGEDGGRGGEGISGTVTLTGGTLTATGGYGGSGGYGGNGGAGISGAVTVSGGTLTATGGNGGTGDYEDGTDGKALGSTIAAEEGYVLTVKAGADAASAVVVETYNGEKYAQATAAAVPAGPFDILYSSMTMGNSLAMNFAFGQDNRTDWTGCYAEIRKTYADGRDDVTQTVAFENWSSVYLRDGGCYYVTFNGIAAKEMTDDVYITVYDADGNAISNTFIDSVRAHAMRNLALDTITDLEKTMVVDMLNYGAAAQEYFSYNTSDLANAQLSEEQKALATESTSYEDTRTGSGAYVASNLMLKSNIQLMFAFRDVTTDMQAVITFTDHHGTEKNITVEGTDFTKNGSFYVVTVEDMVVADSRQDITCTVYDADGNIVGEATDSVESYTARKGDTLFAYLMKFSDSAHAFFHQ